MKDKNIQYEGKCAFALSLGKIDVEGGSSRSNINGKQYAFSNPVAKILFKILPNRAEKADLAWRNRKVD